MFLPLLPLAVVLGLAAAVFSMYGQGGGVVYTPIQVWFGTEFHEAAARSQLLILATSISSAYVFRRRADWPVSLSLEAFAAVGAFAGGATATRFPSWFLHALLGSLALAAAGLLITGGRPPSPHGWPRWALPWNRRSSRGVYSVSLAIGGPAWFVIGWLSGLTGAAGGFLKIPMLIRVFGAPVEVAVACSAVMVGLTATGALAGRLWSTEWDWRAALVLAAPVLAGAQIGPRLSLRFPPKIMRRGLATLLAAVGVLMLLSSD